jgi:hypothetical protein
MTTLSWALMFLRCTSFFKLVYTAILLSLLLLPRVINNSPTNFIGFIHSGYEIEIFILVHSANLPCWTFRCGKMGNDSTKCASLCTGRILSLNCVISQTHTAFNSPVRGPLWIEYGLLALGKFIYCMLLHSRLLVSNTQWTKLHSYVKYETCKSIHLC